MAEFSFLKKIRITIFGTGVIDDDKGVSACIRIVNPQKLSKEDFIKNGTATGEILDFLSICLRYGIIMCATGATSSGKTTLMNWLLSTIPDDKRIFTIENGTREFDLVAKDFPVCHKSALIRCHFITLSIIFINQSYFTCFYIYS